MREMFRNRLLAYKKKEKANRKQKGKQTTRKTYYLQTSMLLNIDH